MLEVLAKAGAIAAGPFDPEDELAAIHREPGGPALKFAVARGTDLDDELPEQLPEPIQRRCIVAVLVGVDPDWEDRPLTNDRSHRKPTAAEDVCWAMPESTL